MLASQVIGFDDHVDQITDLVQGPLPIGAFEVYHTVNHVRRPGLVEGKVYIEFLIAPEPRIDLYDPGAGPCQDNGLPLGSGSFGLLAEPGQTLLIEGSGKG